MRKVQHTPLTSVAWQRPTMSNSFLPAENNQRFLHRFWLLLRRAPPSRPSDADGGKACSISQPSQTIRPRVKSKSTCLPIPLLTIRKQVIGRQVLWSRLEPMEGFSRLRCMQAEPYSRRCGRRTPGRRASGHRERFGKRSERYSTLFQVRLNSSSLSRPSGTRYRRRLPKCRLSVSKAASQMTKSL